MTCFIRSVARSACFNLLFKYQEVLSEMDYFFGVDDSKKWDGDLTKEWSSPSRTVRDSSIGSTLSRTSAGTSVDGNRVLDDLKLTLEMKDHQVEELEDKVASLERQLAFNEGKMSSKLEDLTAEIQTLRTRNMALEEARDTIQDEVQILSRNFQSAHIDFVVETHPSFEEVQRATIVLEQEAAFNKTYGLYVEAFSSLTKAGDRARFEEISLKLQAAESRLQQISLQEEATRSRRTEACCSMM